MAENSVKKPRGKGKPFVKGVSPNPGGRPKNQESITAWLHKFAGMTTDDAARTCELFAHEIRTSPKGLPIAGIIAARALIGLMNDQSVGLFKEVVERMDGKMPQPVAVGGDVNLGPVKIVVEYTDGEEAEAAPSPEDGQG